MFWKKNLIFFKEIIIICYPFLEIIIWAWRYRMGVHRGVNLVGMSLLLLDACSFSWFTEKKKNSLKNIKVRHKLTKMYRLISWIIFFGGTKNLKNILGELKWNVRIFRGNIYLFNHFIYKLEFTFKVNKRRAQDSNKHATTSLSIVLYSRDATTFMYIMMS